MTGAETGRRNRVLVVDDEEQIRRALVSILESRGYAVRAVGDSETALDAMLEGTPDIVVLDLTLPDADGIDVTRRLRAWAEMPILILSVRGGEEDKIAALDAGADDYLTKPFSAGELLARVRALLRRAGGTTAGPSEVRAGDLTIDLARRRVRRGDEEVALTKTEFDILAYLASNADRVLTSRSILEHVWGPEYAEDRQTLRVHVHNLRRKIEPHPGVPRYVLTEPGVGFRFSCEA